MTMKWSNDLNGGTSGHHRMVPLMWLLPLRLSVEERLNVTWQSARSTLGHARNRQRLTPTRVFPSLFGEMFVSDRRTRRVRRDCHQRDEHGDKSVAPDGPQSFVLFAPSA